MLRRHKEQPYKHYDPEEEDEDEETLWDEEDEKGEENKPTKNKVDVNIKTTRDGTRQ